MPDGIELALKDNQEVTDGNLLTLETELRGIISVFHTIT